MFFFKLASSDCLPRVRSQTNLIYGACSWSYNRLLQHHNHIHYLIALHPANSCLKKTKNKSTVRWDVSQKHCVLLLLSSKANALVVIPLLARVAARINANSKSVPATLNTGISNRFQFGMDFQILGYLRKLQVCERLWRSMTSHQTGDTLSRGQPALNMFNMCMFFSDFLVETKVYSPLMFYWTMLVKQLKQSHSCFGAFVCLVFSVFWITNSDCRLDSVLMSALTLCGVYTHALSEERLGPGLCFKVH